MKRENFRITSTVGHNVVKHTWNSSIREIEKLVKALAVYSEANYTLCGSESIKEGFYHVSGSRSWENTKNSCVVVFTVAKED